jgi:hypothetical protein
VLVIGGSIATGAIGTTLVSSEPTKAVSIDSSNFTVPDKEKTVNNTVETVTLNATGSYTLDKNVQPDSIVIRLEASRGPSWTQIDALQTTPDVKDFDLSGNLTSVEGIGHGDINPTNRGETTSIDVSARILIEATKDGKTLGQDKATDTFTVSITKKEAYAEIGMDATGNVTVKTS